MVYDTHEHLAEDILTKHYLPAGLRATISGVAGRAEVLAARGMSAVVAATPHIMDRFPQRSVRRAGVYNYPRAEEMVSAGTWAQRRVQACYVGGISVNRGIRELAPRPRRSAVLP